MRSTFSSKLGVLAVVAAVVALTTSAVWATTMTPINVTGFNRDWVVEASGVSYHGAVTADGEPNTSNLNAMYEHGLFAGSGGLKSGVNTSSCDANTTYLLQSFTANNIVYMDSATKTGALTLSTPAKYTELAFFGTATDNSLLLSYSVNYSDATHLTGSVTLPDWFTSTTYTAVNIQGRAAWNGSSWANDQPTNPNGASIYQFDITGVDPSKNVASVSFSCNPGSTQIAAIWGVSGAAVSTPEPGTLVSLLVGLAGLMAYAWRKRS